MRRIAVIGDSHVSVLRVAHKAGVAGKRAVLRYFVQRSQGTTPLKIARSDAGVVAEIPDVQILAPNDDTLQLEDFDVVVTIGFGFSVHYLARLYRHHRSEFHSDARSTQVLSDRAFHRLARATLDHSPAMRIRRVLLDAGARHVVIQAQPRVNETIVRSKEGPHLLYRAVTAHGDDARLDDTFGALLAEYAEEGVAVLDQPASTRTGRVFTADRWGVEIREPGPRRDYIHMNGDYGALALEQIITACEALEV
jgi:hypothetical protein